MPIKLANHPPLVPLSSLLVSSQFSADIEDWFFGCFAGHALTKTKVCPPSVQV